MLQSCFKDISMVVQGCFKLQGCFEEAYMALQVCCKNASRKLGEVKRAFSSTTLLKNVSFKET